MQNEQFLSKNLSSVAHWINQLFRGSFLEEIKEPHLFELFISFYPDQSATSLLFSCHPELSGVFFNTPKKRALPKIPHFSAGLRKYLKSCTLEECVFFKQESSLIFKFQDREKQKKYLFFKLKGEINLYFADPAHSIYLAKSGSPSIPLIQKMMEFTPEAETPPPISELESFLQEGSTFYTRLKEKEKTLLDKAHRKILKSGKDSIQRLKKNLEKDQKNHQTPKHWKDLADALLLHLSELKKKPFPLKTDYEVSSLLRIPAGSTPQSALGDLYGKMKKSKSFQTHFKELNQKITQMESDLLNLKKNLTLENLPKWLEEKKNRLLPNPSKTQRHPTTKFHSLFPKGILNYTTGSGHTLLVGTNQTSNETLTKKFTLPHDYWFHAQGASGSHVVLKLKSKKEIPSLDLLLQASTLALFYSSLKKSERGHVDYCQKKYLKKPKGTSPGKFLMSQKKTLFIDLAGGQKPILDYFKNQ